MAIIGGIIVLVFLVLALTAYAFWQGAPWVPTPMAAVEAALAAAQVSAGDTVIDIGAGDGRVLRSAVRRGARAIGYELSPLLWLIGTVWTWHLRPAVRLSCRDGFRANLSHATVVFAFLVPKTVRHLVAALACRSGSTPVRVLSYAFALPLPEPPEIITVPRCAPIYLYRLPAAALNADRLSTFRG